MLREILGKHGSGAKVYFIGIGGIGVSGLARIFREAGLAVEGSDAARSPVTDALVAEGVRVHIPQRAENVPPDAVLAIASAAIKPENPELVRARSLGVPCFKYAQVLGGTMAERGRGVAVSGTHGKTTTTAMIAHILVEAGLDPTMVLGGSIPLLGGTTRIGKSPDLFVAEACEYDRSFLSLRATYAVITNIEEDHLDYYRDLDDILSAFRAFASLVPPHGRIFACAESAMALRAVQTVAAPVETYGIATRRADALGRPPAPSGPEADWVARDVDLSLGEPHYTAFRCGEDLGRVALKVPGRHNVLNSLAAFAVGSCLGVPPQTIRAALATFPGVARRFQVIHEANGVAVVDDYAHHPTEVRSVIEAARDRFHGGRVVAIFQPHQHSRTRFLLKDFAQALALADRVVLPDIYFSRDSDEERAAVSSLDLVRALTDLGTDARYLPDLGAIARFVAKKAEPGDAIVTMGAGDIYRVAWALRDILQARLNYVTGEV